VKRKSHAGITSMMLPIFVQDTTSATGAGLGSLTSATSGLVGEYRRQGQSSWTAITLAAGTLGTWSSGGWVADGALAGAYEVGVPDAAVASGARWVSVRYRGAANMLPVLIELELDAVDYQDGTAFGLANLDATVSSRSTYAGGDTAGTTTLLGRLTSTRAGLLDNLDAAISTRSTYAGADTAGTTTLLARLTSGRATNLDNLDVAVSTRSTYAGGDTAGTTTLLTRLSSGRATNLDNLDATVSSRSTYAGGAVASVTAAVAVGSIATDAISAAAVSAAAVTKIQAGLSTYAGTDTAGTTTLLARLTAGRATNLDNLDAAISTRSTYAGGDTAGTTTLLSRLTSGRATNLDNLDAAITTRLAAADYTAPPTSAVIATEFFTKLLSGSDFNTAASFGKLVKDNLDATVSSRSTYAGTDTTGTTTLLARLTGTRATNLDNLDAAITTRSTFAGGAVASVTAGVTVTTMSDKAGYSLAATGLDVIATTAPTGVAATFPGMLVQVWRRFFKKSTKDVASHTIKTYADNEATVITTQTFADDGAGNETLGASS
jgi:hypothetical protein